MSAPSLFDCPTVEPQDDTYKAIRERRPDYREYLDALWRQFQPYADANFPSSIQSDFASRYWEMYLGCALLGIGKTLAPRSSRTKNGPDLLIVDGGGKLWIEAIAPSGGAGPDAVEQPPLNVAMA